MKISEMNWLQVEEYLKTDDRAVVPLGCTEQHAYLSLSVDSILAERVASEAAEPTGVPVFPVQAYGITPYFMAYPGTVSLKAETYLRIITDILDSLKRTGFRRILFVNGHGGNTPGQTAAIEWMGANPGSPREIPQLVERAAHLREGEGDRSGRVPCLLDGELPLDAPARHRAARPPEADGRSGAHAHLRPGRRARDPAGRQFRRILSSGPDEDMNAIWSVAIDETRALIENW